MRLRTTAAAAVLALAMSVPLAGIAAAQESYANCDEARAAGVAPLYVGEPGYAAHLDGDNDGVACEDGGESSGAGAQGSGDDGASGTSAPAPSSAPALAGATGDKNGQQVKDKPRGGVETGDGSSDTNDLGLLLGGLALVAAGGVVFAARRVGRRNNT